MAANRVDIDINARDNASSVIDGVLGNFDRLTQSVTGANSAFGSFMGGLGTAIAFKGLDVVLSTVDRIKSTLLEAAAIQTAFISASSSTSQNLKVSFTEGIDIQKDLGMAIAKAAASQPGSTQDYVAMSDMISGSIARGFEGDKDGFLAATTDLVKTSGLLAQTKGIDTNSAGSTIGRFINGSSGFNQLRNIDFFEKNQDLVFKIDEVAKSKGLDTAKLQDWSQKQRIEVLKLASAQVVTPELLAALNSTADAQIETMKTQLFDPRIGIFGFLRELPTRGNKSILDAVSNFLGGLSTLSTSLGGLMQKLGLGFDPLVPLAMFIDWMSSLMDKLSVIVTGFNPSKLAFSLMTFEGFFEGLTNFKAWDIGANMAKFYGNIIKNLTSSIANVDWVNLGRTIAQLLMKAADLVMGYILNTDFNAIADLALTILVAIGKIAIGILSEMIYTILKDIGNGLKRAFKGVIDAIMWAVNGIKKVVQPLADGVSNVISRVSSPVAAAASAASDLRDNVGNTLSNVFKPKPTNKPVSTLKPAASNKLPTNKTTDKAVATSFNPVINVSANPGMDEDALAKRVVAYFNDAYTSYNAALLT